MSTVNVEVLNEVTDECTSVKGGYKLYLQRVRYHHEGGDQHGRIDEGYRFIWRRPDGTLQAARGQARLPSFHVIRLLMIKAEQQSWGHYVTDPETLQFGDDRPDCRRYEI